MWIGNDIVDLNEPQAQGKAAQDRFLSRVCSVEEKIFVRESVNPHATLWALWAMKEATYKAAKKEDEKTRFIPTDFVCSYSSNGWSCRGASIKLIVTKEFVHAIATLGIPSSAELIYEIKMDGDVRGLALEILERRGYFNCAIIREEKGGLLLPPRIVQNGDVLKEVDLSLSHDGRYLAAALSFCSISVIASPTV